MDSIRASSWLGNILEMTEDLAHGGSRESTTGNAGMVGVSVPPKPRTNRAVKNKKERQGMKERKIYKGLEGDWHVLTHTLVAWLQCVFSTLPIMCVLGAGESSFENPLIPSAKTQSLMGPCSRSANGNLNIILANSGPILIPKLRQPSGFKSTTVDIPLPFP